MALSGNYLDPAVLSELKDFQLRARTIVDGLVAGMHRSPYHGYSVEFAQHREYAPGDDIRHVDWKVFGRTDKLHVKQFEDESNLCCWLLVDRSQSMQYCPPGSTWSKYDYACCLAVTFAWLVLNQRDAVSLGVFAEQMEIAGPPSDRRESLANLVRVLENATPGNEKTGIRVALNAFSREVTRRGIVIVMSDCFDEFESVADGLDALRRHEHQVVLLQVVDPTELTLDFKQSMELSALESGERMIIDPLSLKRAYQQVVKEQTRLLARFCEQKSILFDQVTSDTPIAEVISRVIHRNNGRIHRA